MSVSGRRVSTKCNIYVALTGERLHEQHCLLNCGPGDHMSLLWMVLITVVILQMSVFFTTIYLHRYLTHRGLELNRFVALFMHLELVLFTGIVPREWVAVHRKHHHFSDKEGDPHSPHLLGMWTVLFSNFWLYRKEKRNADTVRRYTRDYKPDVLDRMHVRHY